MSRQLKKRNRDTAQFEYGDEHSIIQLEWDEAITDSGINSTQIRFNNTDYSSVTEIYVGAVDYRNGLDHLELLTDAHNGGAILVSSIDSEDYSILFRISGAVVDNSNYTTIPVTYIAQSNEVDGFIDESGIGIALFPAPLAGAGAAFDEALFRIYQTGTPATELIFNLSALAADRTITMPDTDIDLGDIATNNAKVSNATHTGDATGSTALTLATVNSDVGSFTKPSLTINAKGLVTAATSEIIGGLVVTSTSTTNVANGSYNVLEDTTALTSVNSGIAQDSDWTLEITQAGITNQKGRVSVVIKCEKTGGAGRQYDFAIFKNGSIISDSEMTDLTLENNDTWSNIKCTAPVEMSTGDLFSLRVSGNGTGDDIECTNGTIYIE